MGGDDARGMLSFQEDERPAEPEAVIDEAEVPRRPDAVRGAREEESDEPSPAFAEELALFRREPTGLVGTIGQVVEHDNAKDDRGDAG